jgi:wobble nucleotide-excising tRNase
MAASGHFEFCALPRVAQTFKRGMAAYFATNTLKYQKKSSNFVTQGWSWNS